MIERRVFIAIVGSRKYPHLDQVRAFVHRLPHDMIVVSGGARGVDRVAEETATRRGMVTMIFRPDWKQHGKAAGYVRNRLIVKRADVVVAFHDGRSTGTQHTLDIAQQSEHVKRIQIYFPDGAMRHVR